MKLIDANVFIYAQGKDHPYRQPCRQLLDRIPQEKAAFQIDAETVQELLFVYAARGLRQYGLDMAERVLELFPELLPVDRPLIVEAKNLVAAYSFLLPRDAIHAAAVRLYGLEGIISADRVFERVTGVTRIDPKDA